MQVIVVILLINVRYDTCNKIIVNFYFQVKWSLYFSIICKGYNANG